MKTRQGISKKPAKLGQIQPARQTKGQVCFKIAQFACTNHESSFGAEFHCCCKLALKFSSFRFSCARTHAYQPESVYVKHHILVETTTHLQGDSATFVSPARKLKAEPCQKRNRIHNAKRCGISPFLLGVGGRLPENSWM
jgi:hypothetical protein